MKFVSGLWLSAVLWCVCYLEYTLCRYVCRLKSIHCYTQMLCACSNVVYAAHVYTHMYCMLCISELYVGVECTFMGSNYGLSGICRNGTHVLNLLPESMYFHTYTEHFPKVYDLERFSPPHPPFQRNGHL